MMSVNADRALFRAAVFVMVENNHGEYLLQRRAGTGFLDGYFDVSGSGHLEYGESFEECGVRELYEETHLVVDDKDLELMAIFQSDFEKNSKYINVIYRVSKYVGDIVNGEPTKIDKLEWCKLSDLPDKLTIGTRVFLQSLRSEGVNSFYISSEQYRKMMGEPFVNG